MICLMIYILLVQTDMNQGFWNNGHKCYTIKIVVCCLLLQYFFFQSWLFQTSKITQWCSKGCIFISIPFIRFQDLVAASMKMTVFWDVAPYSLVQTDRHFGGAYLWNVGQFLPDYMVQYPRRQSSSTYPSSIINSLRAQNVLWCCKISWYCCRSI
jgi:hypothetical protein